MQQIETRYGSFNKNQIENLIANARGLRNENIVLKEELAHIKEESL